MVSRPQPHHEQPLVLNFAPALPCSICGRMSNYGEMNNGCDGLLVRCYEHGLVQFTPPGRKPMAYELQELHASVTRFVLASYDYFGDATVIGPIAPRAIPGYEPPSKEAMARYSTQFEGEEDAWVIRYNPNNDTVLTVHVVWSFDENVFSLYDERGQVTL